jgi:hypothetical protein
MSDALRKNGLTLMQTLMVEGDVAGVKALLSYARTEDLVFITDRQRGLSQLSPRRRAQLQGSYDTIHHMLAQHLEGSSLVYSSSFIVSKRSVLHLFVCG